MATAVKSIEIDIGVRNAEQSRAQLAAIDAQAEALKKAFPEYTLKINSAAATERLMLFRGQVKAAATEASKPVEMILLSDKAKAKLLEVKAEAEKLRVNFPEFTVKINDAEAKAKLAVVAAEAKATADVIDRQFASIGGGSRGGSGGLSSLGRAGSTGGGAASSILGGIPGGGGGAGVAAIGLAVPALEAALVEVTGLVSGFAAAGAGAGAFALLAVPAAKQVATAYGNLNTAQQAYAAAQAKYVEAPTKANATALANARLNLDLTRDSLAKMPPAEQGAVRGVQQLTGELGRMSTAFAPEAFKVFNAGLALANKLLPSVTPFANTFADVVSKLLGEAAKFAGTKGFTDWLAQFHAIEGPAIEAIGAGIGKVTIAVGKLFTVMSAKDVAHSIAIAFGIIAGAIDALTFVVSHLMRSWDQLSSAASTATRKTAAVFDDFRHRTAVVFDGIRNDIAHYWDMTWNNTIGRLNRGVADSQRLTAGFEHWTAGEYDLIRHVIASAWDLIWNNTVGRVQRGINDVTAWFRGLPGRVISAVSRLGGDLLSFGSQVIGDFIQGVGNAIPRALGAIGNFFTSLYQKALSILHMSPPHPGSMFYDLGANIVTHLVAGFNSNSGNLAASFKKATEAAAAATAGGGKFLPVPQGGGGSGSVAQEIQYAESLFGSYGWASSQIGPLINLWNQESGWNANAVNPSSGAYGIPQALPAAQGHPYALGDYRAQIVWGENYISARYGSPAAAWAHEVAFNWYDQGGYLPPGLSLAYNGTGVHERVIPPGGGGTTHVHYHVDVRVPPTVNPRQAGQQIADLIMSHTKAGGRLYPQGVTPR